MLVRPRYLAVMAIVVVLSIAVLGLAHPGGRDSSGGHNDRKHGGYHFHAGPLAGQSFASKGDALAALRAHEQPATAPRPAAAPARTTTAAAPPKPSPCNCEALARLLVSKGIITEDELAAASGGAP